MAHIGSGYEACIDNERSLVPINILCLGATIHFFVCLLLFCQCGRGRYESNLVSAVHNPYNQEFLSNDHNDDGSEKGGKCECNPTFIKILKILIAILFFLCAATQTVLDYLQYVHFHRSIPKEQGWKAYQCSVFLFTNSPNALHAVAAFFSFSTAAFMHRFDKSARIALLIFVAGEIIVGILVTPFFASIFTHLVAGLFVYGWIAIFIFAGSIFIFYKMNIASLEHRLEETPYFLFIGVFCSMLLMVLLIVVVNNTQVKLYDGVPYWESLTSTMTERKNAEYLAREHLTTFDQLFTFIWLIL